MKTRKITPTEFFRLLKNAQFRIDDNCIRHKKSGDCPLVYVANKLKRSSDRINNEDDVAAASYLGLTSQFAEDIVAAADDNEWSETGISLRKKLLKLVNLSINN